LCKFFTKVLTKKSAWPTVIKTFDNTRIIFPYKTLFCYNSTKTSQFLHSFFLYKKFVTNAQPPSAIPKHSIGYHRRYPFFGALPPVTPIHPSSLSMTLAPTNNTNCHCLV